MRRENWKVLLALAMLHVVLFAVLVQESWINTAIRTESRLNAAVMGEAVVESAADRGGRWYRRAFVDTGAVAAVFGTYTVPDRQRAQAGLQGLGSPLFDWFETRMRVLFTLVRQASVRLSIAVVWLPYLFMLLLPAVADGLVKRKVRSASFGHPSPLRHGYGLLQIQALAVLALLMLFAPWPMPATILALVSVPAMLALWIVIAHAR